MKTIAAAAIPMSRAEPDDIDVTHDAGSGANVRDVPVIVGTNLRRLRKAQGLSLERLAELSGVSRAMLGQIETAKSVPTVSLLWRVADALGVPVTTLVATDSEPAASVLTRERSSVLVASHGRYAARNLSPANRHRPTGFFEIRIDPGHREEFPAEVLGTRVHLVVAEGGLAVYVGSEPLIELDEGDAVTFEASTPYAFENTTNIKSTLYLVTTTATS